MQMKASVEYGLKAVLYLASRGGLVSSREIANDMSIPRDYLIQLAQLLRNAGIVEARPGKHGGYRLAKDPSDISLYAVLSALNDGSSDAEGNEASAEPGVTAEIAGAASRGDAFVGGGLNDAVAPSVQESVSSVKKACLLAQECFDAYLDGISIEALLECSRSGGSGRACLGTCLCATGGRLLE